MLYRLVYRSRSCIPAEDAPVEVDRLLRRAKAANAATGITGALLLADGHFLQAIEGPLEAVEALFERICSDFRHRDVQLLDFAPAEDRLFRDWAMEQVEAEVDLVARLPLATGAAATGEATLQLLMAQLPPRSRAA
jgi:hypothetical protein